MKEGLTSYLGACIDELVQSGVRHIVISPGSRSTPLAMLAAVHQGLTVWTNIDERSAGFFALGMAKAHRAPIALLCTSGTAAANYMPAVVEAYLSRAPLIVLTADRPHELRDVGAPQTMDQVGLYGQHVKWFMDMPLPEASESMIRHARMAISRAAIVARLQPCGPVHLNFPLREPLVPNLRAVEFADQRREPAGQSGVEHPYTLALEGKRTLEVREADKLARELLRKSKGLIICGPHDDPKFASAVRQLAEQLGYPLLADPLSQLRGVNESGHTQPWIVDGYDAILRSEQAVEQLQPEVLIRFGAMPVSKSLFQFIVRHQHCRHIIVDDAGDWRDPSLLMSDLIIADPNEFCQHMCEAILRVNSTEAGTVDGLGAAEWRERWIALNEAVGRVLSEAGSDPELTDSELTDPELTDNGNERVLFEGRLFIELQSLMRDHSILFVGNSMPIRDLDTFFTHYSQTIRLMGNRGANGIDGIVSTALGVSTLGMPTVLVLGDLSFYHDLNGLLAAKLHALDLTIIVVNNDGGGIFSFLPQAEEPEHFEKLFGTPTGLDYAHAVSMYGGKFRHVASWQSFREQFTQAQSEGGLQVLEVRTERGSNARLHRQLWQKASDQVAALLKS